MAFRQWHATRVAAAVRSTLMNGLTRRWMGPAASNPGDPLVDRVLEARGLGDRAQRATFLEPRLSDLADPDALPGSATAAALLADACRKNKRIHIYGDYDADGITAAAVLHHAIAATRSGEGPAIYIPHRVDEGYGMHPEAIERLADDGAEVIISVDCGITAIDAADVARQRGIDLIITDHHQPRSDGKLPRCAAIVHPALDGEPGTPLAGVGVAFTLARSLARAWGGAAVVTDRLRQRLNALVPLVAIGTVADLVPLVEDNRRLVRSGAAALSNAADPGLAALVRAAGLSGERAIGSGDIAFRIAPLLNAAGRLAHASAGADLLTHLDGPAAETTAQHLATLNRDRQAAQKEIVEQALAQVDEMDEVPPIIVLADERWHRGIVGVAASKVQDRHHRPVILLAEEDGQLHGSGRSISGYSILDGLDAAASHLARYGGHVMAAGLTLRSTDFAAFIEAITSHAAAEIDPQRFTPSVTIDATAAIGELDLAAADGLERMAPFGMGNPRPVVRTTGVVRSVGRMGREGAHLEIRIFDGRARDRGIRCIWWGRGDLCTRFNVGDAVEVAARPQVNTFRGARSVELVIADVALPGGKVADEGLDEVLEGDDAHGSA